MFKVNWDAIVDKTNGCIGIYFLVRDHEGVILATHSTTQSLLADPIVAEAMVAMHAVVFCRELGFLDIIL
jgi:hypothetical protein